MDEAAGKESLQTTYNAAQKELSDLEDAAITVCQELEGKNMLSGSSTISRLRALGGQMSSRLKDALFLGV